VPGFEQGMYGGEGSDLHGLWIVLKPAKDRF
jgi:hypothetical protein